MTVAEFREKTCEICKRGTVQLGMFSETHWVDENNHCRYEDDGYNVYLTYEGKNYHYGFNSNGVEEENL